MDQFYFTGAHLKSLEGRGLIFSKMRQICTKDKLQILQNTIELKCIPNISYIIYFQPKIKPSVQESA